jgi:glycosyltransferase involved in cell wall biosynthesis
MNHRPKVSVVLITYNQEKYVHQAMNSFIAQETNFRIEIVVADDCSTDNTPRIINEYARQYPDLVKPIAAAKNVGVMKNFLRGFRAAQGEYIAVCEGDDYWTDTKKLQLQADHLDKHPDYAISFHPVRVFFEGSKDKDYIYPNPDEKNTFNTAELLKRNFIQTNSVMYKKQKYKHMPDNILPVDWYMHLYHAQFGKIAFMNRVMSDYRRHAGGLWWNSQKDMAAIWKKHSSAQLNLYAELMKLFGKDQKHRKIITTNLENAFRSLLSIDLNEGTKLFQSALVEQPEHVQVFVVELYKSLQYKDDILQSKENDIAELQKLAREQKQLLQYKDWMLRQKDQELSGIKASPFWKIRNSVAKLTGKPKI